MPRVIVVGCGHWGRNHVRNYAQLGALGGIVDTNSETASRLAAEHGVPAFDFQQALRSDAEGVAICAPAGLHASLALDAMRAGKHVFVEKPIALSREDARRMRDASEKAGRVLMVGHILQFHPAFAALRDLVRRGDLGDLRYAYSNRLSLGKFRVEEDVLWSFAPHDISMLLALFGETPARVSGGGQAYVTDGVADTWRIDMEFSRGRSAHAFVSWLHPFKEHRLVVVGETGMVVFEDSAPSPEERLRLYRHVINASGPAPVASKKDFTPVPYPDLEPLQEECKHFLHCVRTGERPLTDAAEGLAALDVMMAASRVAA